MSGSRRDLTDTRFYPVLFMIIVTVVFIGILATFYLSTQQKVELYKENNRKLIILDLFGLPTTDISSVYNKRIRERSIEGTDQTFYEAWQDSLMLGYCFPVSGNGLWGTINALIAVSPDLKDILAMEIVSQNETPGLGGRITEDWFKDQFRNIPVVKNDRVIEYELIAEEENQQDYKIRQITGASGSSKAVVNMLYKEMLRITSFMGNEND
jgi:Na+-transporting NADH:ubiquinone oxidoreductase subunit C